jgi:hypothetical protein
MGPLDLLLHILNLLAPAFVVAAAVTLAGRRMSRQSSSPPSAGKRWAIQVGVGCAVLMGGLVLLGRDGKMATYGALVVAVATSQWLMQRGWRR